MKRVTETVDGDYLIVQNLDEIAWLLNMRGNDIDYNPLFYSFIVVAVKDKAYSNGTLYIRKEKVSETINKYLE